MSAFLFWGSMMAELNVFVFGFGFGGDFEPGNEFEIGGGAFDSWSGWKDEPFLDGEPFREFRSDIGNGRIQPRNGFRHILPVIGALVEHAAKLEVRFGFSISEAAQCRENLFRVRETVPDDPIGVRNI